MNRLTRDLSNSQLKFSVIIFAALGTILCVYNALSGFLSESQKSMNIDAVKVLKPAYSHEGGPMHSLDLSFNKYAERSNISRYIDSVINTADLTDLSKNQNSIAEDFSISPKLKSTNSSNYKK
ncbi:hypothetical protein K6T82_03640 [Flavobacterium sp. 17A]|uniref:Uncharacterized protein n=1 Tax=Flavobacterium potami TaxID=2872310 RepID=A0A9X1H8F0_9FLAO|nr:hypothetical protein [Flavobacterium potami]MBZ4033844.1 hypothetical protein [Flavobacterium potami]